MPARGPQKNIIVPREGLTRRQFIKATGALGAILASPTVLAACTPAPAPDPDPDADDDAAAPEDVLQRLVVGTASPEVTLDPGTSFDGSSILLWPAAYETLVDFEGPPVEMVPRLAESFETSEDGLTHVLNLRSGVTFHDGEPFDAEAAKLNIERIVDLEVGLSFVLQKAQLETPDDMTLVMRLEEFEEQFLSALASTYSPHMISPKAIRDNDDDDFARAFLRANMVGTGPYILDSYAQNEQVIFTRNPNYWGGAEGTHLDEIVIQYITDASSLRLELEQGAVDLALFLPDDIILELEDSPGVVVADAPSFSSYFIELDCQEESPTGDPRVRQAISYGFDYDGWIESFYGGRAERARGPIATDAPSHNPDARQYDYDPDRARELLAEAGFPDGGFTLNYVYETGFAEWKRPLGELFQSNMRDLGINVEVRELSPSAWADILGNPESATGHITAFVAAGNVMLRAFDTLFLFWGTAAQGAGGLNWGFYSNPEFDALIANAVAEPDDDVRNQLYFEAQEILTEDAPAVFMYYKNNVLPMRDTVEGYEFNPMKFLQLEFDSLYKSG